MNNYNVLYIHTHDSGKIFNIYGYDVPTINYSQLAKDALIFDNAFCVSPTCSPSRGGLLTGLYPHNNGMIGLTNRGFKLNDYNNHIVRILDSFQYHTLLCGIQHEYGRYTEHEAGANHIGYKEDITTEMTGFTESEYVKWDRNNADALCSWLNTYDKDVPFFASFGMFSTHRKYPDVTKELKKTSFTLPEWMEEAEEVQEDFLGHIESLKTFDYCIGKVVDALERNHLLQKTIIVVTTDHGIAFPNAKCTLRDQGIGVNFIMRIPGNKNNSKHYPHLFSHVDFVPTLLSLLELPIPQSIDGFDFSGSILGEMEPIRDEVYGEVNFHTSFEPMRCVRTPEYKYIKYFDEYAGYNLSNMDDSISKSYYIESGFFKGDKQKELLFDLKKDPYEKKNCIYLEEYQNIRLDLQKKLDEWMHKENDFLLDEEFKIKPEWIVNTPNTVSPKEKDEKFFVNI